MNIELEDEKIENLNILMSLKNKAISGIDGENLHATSQYDKLNCDQSL